MKSKWQQRLEGESDLTQRYPNAIPGRWEDRTMKRSASFLPVLMFSVVVTVLLANLSPAEAAGGNCQGKLVGNSYDCNEKYSDSSSDTECYKFETGGVSQNFDIFIGFADYGCACDTTGSFNSPSFDRSSSTFECLSTLSGFLINGKLKGKKLKGQGTDVSGVSVIVACTERTSPCP
jgi:hypothetical protein